MHKFILGFVMGIILGMAGSSFAAQLVGGNGYLFGWDVNINGETVCSSPYVWGSLKEIECD